jgi:hypothetical protein
MVLGVILFLSTMFLGGAAFIELSTRGFAAGRNRWDVQARLRGEAAAAVEGLLADPTPFADSPLDPVWSLVTAPRGDGIRVRLEDLSSRLGLNWVREEVLEDSDALLPGRTAQEVQDHRESAGLSLDLRTGYGAFVDAEALERLFTPYGWFNINVTDEFVLRAVHRARGGDAAEAERFHAAVRQARIAHRVIGPEALEEFLGAEDYRLLFPVVNAEPTLNLHYVPEQVLQTLASHFDVPGAGARSLLQARAAREVTPGELGRLLDATPNGEQLAPYLGLRTWFWRITVEQSSRRLEWIVAREPRPDGSPSFRVVEERFEP